MGKAKKVSYLILGAHIGAHHQDDLYGGYESLKQAQECMDPGDILLEVVGVWQAHNKVDVENASVSDVAGTMA